MLLLITECGAPKVSQEDDLPPRHQLDPWSRIKRLPLPPSRQRKTWPWLAIANPSPNTFIHVGWARVHWAVLHMQIHLNLTVLTARQAPINPPWKCKKKKNPLIGGEWGCLSKREGACCRTFANMLSVRFGELRMGRSLVSTVCRAWSPNKTAGVWLLVSRINVFATLERSNSAADDNHDFRFGVGGWGCGFSCQMIAASLVHWHICWNTWNLNLGS